MQKSSLVLVRQFILRFDFSALDSSQCRPAGSSGSINSKSSVTRIEEKPEYYRMAFTVNNNGQASSQQPFTYDIEVVGIFHARGDCAPEEAEALIVSQGSSALYSFARATLAQITALSPHGAYTLPLMTFDAQKPASPDSRRHGGHAKK